jgi:hypothetical protein
VRLFALIGALLVTGGVYLLVDGGLRLHRTLNNNTFTPRIWATEFWLPSNMGPGLGPNAHWFLRLAGGVPAALLGMKLLRVATR